MNKHTIAAVLSIVLLLLTACSAPEKAPEPEKPEPAAPAPAAEAPKPEPPSAEPPKAEAPIKEAPKTDTTKAEPAKKPAESATPPKEITSSSGLKMIDLKVGQGEAVKKGDTVQVHYTGWFYENGKRGSRFDSSVGSKPLDFTVGVSQIIDGWHEGVVGMKPGGKRELIIPPSLAYGARGRPGIPPNSTLDFEIELLKILK